MTHDLVISFWAGIDWLDTVWLDIADDIDNAGRWLP